MSRALNTSTAADAAYAADAADDVQPPKLDLSAIQLAGGALASVTSAIAASRFGVNGTVLGAAFGSLVSGVAAAVYATSLKSAHYRLKTTRTLVLRAPVPVDREPAVSVDPADPTAMPPELSGRAVQLPGATVSVPSGSQADQALLRPRRERPRRPIWRPIALFAGVAFVASMIGIGVLETAIGHPVSNAKGSGTSVGVIVGGGSAETSDPTTTATTSTSGSQAASPSPSGSSPSPSTTDPVPTDSSAAGTPGSGDSPVPTGVASPAPSDIGAGTPTGTASGTAQPTPGATG